MRNLCYFHFCFTFFGFRWASHSAGGLFPTGPVLCSIYCCHNLFVAHPLGRSCLASIYGCISAIVPTFTACVHPSTRNVCIKIWASLRYSCSRDILFSLNLRYKFGAQKDKHEISVGDGSGYVRPTVVFMYLMQRHLCLYVCVRVMRSTDNFPFRVAHTRPYASSDTNETNMHHIIMNICASTAHTHTHTIIM